LAHVQRETTNAHFRAMILNSSGYLEPDLYKARAHHADALNCAMQTTDAMLIGQMLIGVADLALRQGNPHQAAQLLAAGDAVRGAPDLSSPDAVRVDAAARAALSEQEFAEATRSGSVATVHEVAAITLGSAE
jgi:hypothetical protein